MTPSVSFIGWTNAEGVSTYSVVLNDVGNHYGQITLGRVWSVIHDGKAWWRFSTSDSGDLDAGTGDWPTRAKAAKALWEAWGSRIPWNGRKP